MGETTSERAERLKGSLADAMVAVPEGQFVPATQAVEALVGEVVSLPVDMEVTGAEVRRWFAVGLRAGYAFGLAEPVQDAATALLRSERDEARELLAGCERAKEILELARDSLIVERDEARAELAATREECARHQAAVQEVALRASKLEEERDEAERDGDAVRQRLHARMPVVEAAIGWAWAFDDDELDAMRNLTAETRAESPGCRLLDAIALWRATDDAQTTMREQVERLTARIRGELNEQLAQPNPFLARAGGFPPVDATSEPDWQAECERLQRKLDMAPGQLVDVFFGPKGPLRVLRTTAEAAQEALRRLLVNEHVGVDELQRTHDELRAALHLTGHWRQTPADEPYVEPVESQAWRALYTTAEELHAECAQRRRELWTSLRARHPILAAALRLVDSWGAEGKRSDSPERADFEHALEVAVRDWRRTTDAEIERHGVSDTVVIHEPLGQLAADLPPSEATDDGEWNEASVTYRGIPLRLRYREVGDATFRVVHELDAERERIIQDALAWRGSIAQFTIPQRNFRERELIASVDAYQDALAAERVDVTDAWKVAGCLFTDKQTDLDAKLSGLTLVDTFERNVAGPPPYAWTGGLVSSDPQLQVVSVSPPSTPVDFGAIVEPEPPYRLSHDERFPVEPIFNDEQIERARWLAGVPAWQRSIERWCRLVSHVNSVLFGMEYPSDCVCGLLPNDWSWRRSEHLERIVEQLVLDAIAAIDRHGDLMARNVIGGVRYGDIEGLGAVHRAAYDAAKAAVRASELDGIAERVKERTDYVGERKGCPLVVAEAGDA